MMKFRLLIIAERNYPLPKMTISVNAVSMFLIGRILLFFTHNFKGKFPNDILDKIAWRLRSKKKVISQILI